MEDCSLDPYEQQLLKVFDSHDNESRGSLDKEGLIKLCETLQLEDRANELAKVLLEDRKTTRVTFTEFKDALLNLLGNIQSRDEIDINTSPEREVSPKFVYGSKKYGRRSRPRCEEKISNREQSDVNYNSKSITVSVQRSNSQSEVSYSKKRKTNIKLKRCTSFPSMNDYQNTEDLNSSNLDSDVIYTEEMLREAWKKLGVGEDGYLNQTELIIVCDAIGLNKLADSVIRQLSNKLVLDYNKKISFQELLETLQQDETWNEFLNTSPDSELDIHNLSLSSATSFHNSKIWQHVKLGPDGSGYINSEVIVELWEHAGIISPKLLLTDLGFKRRHINIQELSTVLEKEIKGLNELRIDHTSNPHVALLQAFLTLYQTEIKCLRNILEQMQDEREKLKCDVFEANNRATLLAQEVDDNVANMELNKQKHVKLLEQRHSELLKEVTEQFSTDKEQMAVLNQNLELKIKCLENEELKLRDELLNAQKYANALEKENLELTNKICELQQTKLSFEQQIDMLEMEKLKFKDAELEQRDKLIIKLSELQLENTTLKDKHDEMVSKIESLANENSALKCKSSTIIQEDEVIENISVCEGVSLGAKRRNGNSPSEDLLVLGRLGDGSPRLGKVRKFHKNKLNFAFNESGYDTEMEGFSSTLNNFDTEEVSHLQSRVLFLEQILRKHSIEIPSNSEYEVLGDDQDNERLKNMMSCCQKLKDLMVQVKSKIKNINIVSIDKNYDELKMLHDFLEKNLENDTNLSNLSSTSLECEKTCKINQESNVDSELLPKLKKLELENQEFKTKCKDLESGMGLLRNEYEKCEDYWQNKLDNERQLFEQEQNHNTEKLNELISKLSEFEDQYLRDNRLPTIIESGNLEKQFTDLELEFEEYKNLSKLQLDDKELEVTSLKDKLNGLSMQSKSCADVTIQVSDDSFNDKHLNLSNHVIESTNLYSADTMPFNWNNNFNLGEDTTDLSYPYQWSNVDNCNETNSLPTPWKIQPNSKSFSLFTLPSTSNSTPNESKSMPCRQKRTRQHDKLLTQHRLQKRNNNEAKNDKFDAIPESFNGFPEVTEAKCNEPKCWIPISFLQNLQSKRYSLEQRCKKLQLVLKQQHIYDEQLLHYTWQQYRNEKAELQYCIKYYHDKLDQQMRVTNEQQERLARNDSLVKDLFVDNSYLMAKNQRLEQQCHMLSHSFNANSV